MKIDPKDKNIKDIANKAIKAEQKRAKYGLSNLGLHTHNGTDSPRINESDLVRNIKIYAQIAADSSPPNPATLTIPNVPNLNSIKFYGYAVKTDERATINGEAQFGRNYLYNGTTFVSLSSGSPILQSSNYFYSNEGSGTFQVGLATIYLAYVNDGSSDVATVEVVSYSNGIVSLTSTMAAGWSLIGNLILT